MPLAVILILILSATSGKAVVPALTADAVRSRLERDLNELPEILARDPTGRMAQQHLNRQRVAIDVIQPYIYTIPGALHEDPPGRSALVSQIEGWLAPFEPTLVAMLSATARDNIAPNAAVQVLFFAKPSDHLKDALLTVARDPMTNPQMAGEAYEALFMLELDDQRVRNEVIEQIGKRDELHTRAELGKALLVSASTRWAMEEMLPLYRQYLSVPYRSENYPKRGGKQRLLGDYDMAIRGLKAFGELGQPLAQLLKARLSELDPSENSDLINSFNETIMMVEGKCNPKPAVSWKGKLLGVSKKAWPRWIANHNTTQMTASTSAVTPSSISLHQSGAMERTERTPESRDDRVALRLLMWGMVIAVAFGLLFFLFRSRKK
jgi:hypothetical protein